ncbi:ABC transporter permease [Candidatus Bipolaricaulota bacterium]|nr:ABC transporter permease [Candidatus Bipolaricaulota bacterium]
MIEWGILPKFVLDGLFIGSYYGLLALGVSIVFGVLDIGDVAQGGLFTVGGYLTYTVVEGLGFSYFLAPVFVIPLTAVVSILFGTFVYRKLREYGIAPTFLGAVSLLLIVQSLIAIIYGERAKTISSPFLPRMIQVGPASIFSHKLFVILITIFLATLVWFLLQKTRWGKGLRAISQNQEAASLVGVNFPATTAIAFALAGSLSGLAGFLTSPVYTFTPFTGRFPILKAFVISRISMGSIPGVIGLAATIGVAESLTSVYFLGKFSNLIPFVLLIIVMLFRPEVLGPEERRQIRRRDKGRIQILLPGKARLTRILFLVGLVVPFFVDLPSYLFHLAVIIGIASIAVTSLDLLYGYVGSPSLAQGAFFGVGAYASAVLTMKFGDFALLGLVGGLVLSGLVGLIIGLIGVRAGRHWTSFTFITTIIFTILFTNLDFITGGASGISGVPTLALKLPGIEGLKFNPFLSKQAYYILVIIVLGIILWMKHRILNSWFGRSIKAIREDEGLAKSIGIPTRKYKILTFGLSASVAGLGGALYAHYVTFLHPNLFNFVTSFRFLMMNRIGGLGSFFGPLLGATVLNGIEELTQYFNSYLSQIIFSGILIVSLLYMPGGLIGLGERVLGKVLPEKYVKVGEVKKEEEVVNGSQREKTA